jgi:hypothetical protein
MTLGVLALPAATNFVTLVAHACAGAAIYGVSLLALNFFDARRRASALFQSIAARLRVLVHTSFTDRADVRSR